MMIYLILGIALANSFAVTATAEDAAVAEGRQLTFSGQNHELDGNDNFSRDGKYLCYDTRETVGVGIDHGTTIEVLELATGREIILYKPDEIIAGDAPAPGVGAVSFSLAAPEVAFIHGPPVSEVPERGAYGKPNRNGGRVTLDGEIVERDGRWHMLKEGAYGFSWIDKRDVAVDRDTLPGAHRGGTHRHEYSRNGKRIGFTYDDFLLPDYGRTIGYMEANTAAPSPVSHYFALLVSVVPKGTSQAGEVEKAHGDSWVDAAGTMRAFIGVVRNEDGKTFEESLFVADIPLDVDISTADSGNAERYPSPPQGVHIRRLTHDWAGGIVRGAPDGKQIAYYGTDKKGIRQIFVIPADGSDKHEDPAMCPRQVTFLPKGTESGLRWYPDGKHILCLSDGGLVKVRIDSDTGEYRFLTPHGDAKERYAPVISVNGKQVAYNCLTPTFDKHGTRVFNYTGKDYCQIFMVDSGI